MSTKPKILLIHKSQQTPVSLTKLMEANTNAQIIVQANDQHERWVYSVLQSDCDLAVFCIMDNAVVGHFLEHTMSLSAPVPVIALLNNPTVNQAMDMIDAGFVGVADYHDETRVLDLIQRKLENKNKDTHRKALARQLKERAINIRAVLNVMNDFVFVIDQDANIIAANWHVTDKLGYTSEELIGQSILCIHAPEYRQEAQRIIEEIRHGTRQSFSIPLQTKDGVKISVSTRLAAGELDGKPIFFMQSKDFSEINQSKEKFEALFHSNPAIAGLSSIETGEYVEVNQAFCEKLGFTMEEAIGAKATDLVRIDPEWRTNTLQKLQVQGYVQDEETVIFTRDGTPMSVLLSAKIITIDGKLYNYTTAIDISELKQAESALKLEKERLKSLIDSETNYVVRIDLEGNYSYCNSKFEKDFSWTVAPKPLLGTFSLESIAPYHHEHTADAVMQCMAEPGVPVQVELDKVSRDDNYQSVLWEFICLTDAQGAPTEIQCMGINITHFKQAQQTVQYQANILQQISDAVITFDNDKKITSWNQAATNIYGWTDEEALGQRMEDLVEAEFLTDSHEIALESFVKTGHWTGEIYEKSKSGQGLYIVSSVNRLFDKHQNPIGGIIINRNVTAEKKRDILQEHIQYILESTAQRQPLPVILEDLIRAIEEFNPDVRVSILLLDSTSNQLKNSIAPSLPQAYNTAIDGLTIGAGVGSCGTAAYEKRLVIVDDIDTDPLWKDFRDLASQHGLKACWSNPIMGHDNNVLGTLAMYYGEPHTPTQAEIDLIRLTAHIAGLVIDHARAEQQILIQNEFLHQSRDAIAMADKDGTITYMNQGGADLLGVSSPEEVIGKRLTSTHLPDSEEHTLQGYAPKSLDGSEYWRGENRLKTLDGRVIDVDQTLFPIRDKDGNWVSAATIIVDISERKQAEDQIKRSEKRYRQMFERKKLAKLIIDPQTAHILHANPAAVAFYGYPLETLKTMNMSQINIAPREEILEKMAQVLAGERDTCDFTQRLADGTLREVEGYTVVIDHEGKDALYCTYIDVTERNQARTALQEVNKELENRVQERTKALKKSRDRIEAIFNHSADGILLLDNTLKVEQSNYACNEMFQLPHDNAFGESLFDLVSDKDRALIESYLPDIVENHETKNLEVEGKRRDGTLFAAEISIAPVNRSDRAIENIVCVVRDISERRQIQQAIAEERNLLRTVIDAVPNFIFVKNSRSEVILNNTSHADFLEKRITSNSQTKTFFNHLETDLQEKVKLTDKHILETGQSLENSEDRVMLADDTELWLSTTKVPLRNLQDEIIGIVGITSDITDFKRQQARIRESEERYRSTIESMSEGLVVQGADGSIQLWNHAAEIILGLTTEEIDGRSSLDPGWHAIHEDDSPFPGEEHPAMVTLRTGEPQSNVVMGLRKSHDKVTWIEINTQLLASADDESRAVVATFIDITERKRAEEQLRESEVKFRMFIESAPVATIVSDLRGKITLHNRASEKLFSYNQDEWDELSIDMLIPDYLRNGHDEKMDRYISDESYRRTVSLEVTAQDKNGRVFPVEVELSLIKLQPSPLVMSLIIDITDRKHAEEALKLALEHEKELGQMKSRFISTASHQFRTPLAAIYASTETLTRLRDRLSEEQIEARLERIRTQVNRMKVLMDDVLELARMQAKQIQYKPVRSNFYALCKEVINDFDHQPDYRDRIVYEGITGALVAEFDPHLIHHVVSNLVHNALKYSNKSVTVSLTLAGQEPEQEIVFAVKDQGIGIPEADIKQLFVPFTRASNVGVIEGTGLGLSIVKQATEAHDGSIEIESTVDIGTTFIVRLPYRNTENNSHG